MKPDDLRRLLSGPLNDLMAANADQLHYLVELTAAVEALAEIVIASAPDPSALENRYRESRDRLQRGMKSALGPRLDARKKRAEGKQ